MVLIEAMEVVPYALPFKRPYISARGRLERRGLILIRLRTDLGLEGLGEAAPMALRDGPTLEAIFTDLEDRCRPVLEGASLDTDTPEELVARCRENGVSLQALAAVEIALLDLAAKLADRPLWRFLGAERAKAVTCNATLMAGDPDEVAADAQAWKERGFRTFKLKLGTGRERDLVGSVRDAIGKRARIRVDANAVWDPSEAVERLKEIEEFGIELAEQPVAELEELAALRKAVSIPIAADESVVEAADARRAAKLDACDMATVKLAKSGGIQATREIAEVIPVYLSSALDGPVGIAAAVHAAQMLPEPGAGFAHGLATGELFSDSIAARECELHGDKLEPGADAGLGVEIDKAALKRCRL